MQSLEYESTFIGVSRERFSKYSTFLCRNRNYPDPTLSLNKNYCDIWSWLQAGMFSYSGHAIIRSAKRSSYSECKTLSSRVFITQ